MTREEFLAALLEVRGQYQWYESGLGELRAHIPGPSGEQHSTITALCELRIGVSYDFMLDWEKAAAALGLSLEDASDIVSAEDLDQKADKDLAKALRAAVGLRKEVYDVPA